MKITLEYERSGPIELMLAPARNGYEASVPVLEGEPGEGFGVSVRGETIWARLTEHGFKVKAGDGREVEMRTGGYVLIGEET